MKQLLLFIRWIVGLLFIFSGLVKANDPLGLSYKMQEFFDVWGMHWLHPYSLVFSVLIIAFEIIAGVAVIIGWRMKLFSWLLLLLIFFFTFLTGYAALSGKIKTCGCFGDCIPLSAMQSFLKDVGLLLLIAVIFIRRKELKALLPPKTSASIITLTVVLSFGFQWYVLRHLPVVDCLPFKKGNNLLEQMKIPANATFDVYEYRFVYEKQGVQQEFPVNALPDSSWTFVDRKQLLVKKGQNNEPPIKDFVLKTPAGTDTTEALLTTRGRYYFLFVQYVEGLPKDVSWREYVAAIARRKPLFVATAQPEAASAYFSGWEGILPQRILSCDVTAIKTAARAIPTLYEMEGPVVVNKWSGADFDKIQ